LLSVCKLLRHVVGIMRSIAIVQYICRLSCRMVKFDKGPFHR
jgi:hypothetical protein